jgi:hypothetical protein
MAERLDGSVFTNAYVYQINHSAHGVEVTADTITVRARRAVVTLPPALAGRIRYDPPLPASRDHLTESTPMGWIIKVHCIYPARFWHSAGLSGGVTSDDGAIRTTADNSPPSRPPGILVGLIEGDAARKLAAASLSERGGQWSRIACDISATRGRSDGLSRMLVGDDAFARPAIADIRARACGRHTAPTFEPLSEPCIGPAPRPPQSGMAK